MSGIVPPTPAFQFSIVATNSNPAPRFGPRLGTAILRRANGHEIKLETPALLASASRGVVPHLSRDQCRSTKAIKWVNVPFETFLEQSPPIPTLQQGPSPLHTFLGYLPSQHVLSMAARNPSDGREMPPNGNTHVSVNTLHGVRKLTPPDWNKYTHACQPDIIFALSDTPFTSPPYSQKRLTKSIERSATWLLNLFSGFLPSSLKVVDDIPLPGVFVQMAGSISLPARQAFAASLVERLDAKEAEAVAPLGFKRLDDGVAGYSFDLLPLQLALSAVAQASTAGETVETQDLDIDAEPNSKPLAPLTPLLRMSLHSLSTTKPRLVNSVRGPHEMLHLIRDVGVDLFDAGWAVEAANVGVALDFSLSVSSPPDGLANGAAPTDSKKQIGHNIYHTGYALDFSPLADSFVGAATASSANSHVCPCNACSPVVPATRIAHDQIKAGDEEAVHNEGPVYKPALTRAYLHHLLHTHEMSAHAFLVMHNLSVVDRFLKDIREVIASNDGVKRFEEGVERFEKIYSDDVGQVGIGLIEEARKCWKEVDLARGKGRLKREKQMDEGNADD